MLQHVAAFSFSIAIKNKKKKKKYPLYLLVTIKMSIFEHSFDNSYY